MTMRNEKIITGTILKGQPKKTCFRLIFTLCNQDEFNLLQKKDKFA